MEWNAVDGCIEGPWIEGLSRSSRSVVLRYNMYIRRVKQHNNGYSQGKVAGEIRGINHPAGSIEGPWIEGPWIEGRRVSALNNFSQNGYRHMEVALLIVHVSCLVFSFLFAFCHVLFASCHVLVWVSVLFASCHVFVWVTV